MCYYAPVNTSSFAGFRERAVYRQASITADVNNTINIPLPNARYDSLNKHTAVPVSPNLGQCFATFVRPRPGKFFFHKTRTRSQQIYSSIPFQFF